LHPEYILISLSDLIPESLVPIEDWIKTVSFLIDACSKKPLNTNLDSVIHSICMASTSLFHKALLVDEGILGYWDRILKGASGGGDDALVVAVLESISHVNSIRSVE
jgi:hypothetical protein